MAAHVVGDGKTPAADELEELIASERRRWAVQRERKGLCMRCLVELAQLIEGRWADERARLALLAVFREWLLDLAESKHEEVRWMGVLGRKMKSLHFSLDHFLNIALPLEREHTRGLQEFEFLRTTIAADSDGAARARSAPALARRKALHVVADNMRSAFNVGALFRTAECLGAAQLHLCGYTATPESAQVQKTSMGTHAHVEWAWSRSALAAIEALREQGVASIALETVHGAPLCWDYEFPSPCAIVLGNEYHGLGPDVLAACAGTVQLPCVGVKNSMNVGVAFGMCAYEMLRQWEARDAAAGSEAVPDVVAAVGEGPASVEGTGTRPRSGSRYAPTSRDEGL
jgi:tRNA G18 (ribose-2'-O)-methylase SpoU